MSLQWYARYPGDYMRDTGHLSLTEDGAYNRLLDHYYATGRAIPPGPDAACRICRASTPDERTAVEAVLGQFFTLEKDGYHNARADAEIDTRNERHDALSEAGKRGVARREANRKKPIKPGMKPPIKPGLSKTTTTTTTISTATTRPPDDGGERGGSGGLVDQIRTCRPEYGKLQPQAIMATLAGCPTSRKPDLHRIVADWCVAHANMLEPFNAPLASLKIAIHGKPGKGQEQPTKPKRARSIHDRKYEEGPEHEIE